MIGFLEKVVWVITIIVILGNMALVIWGKREPTSPPSAVMEKETKMTKVSDLGKELGIKITDKMKKRLNKNRRVYRAGEKKTITSSDKAAGLKKKFKSTDAEKVVGGVTVPVKKFKVASSAVEKYTNFADLYDEVSKSNAVFTQENGEPIIYVKRVQRNSIVDRIGIKKGDKIHTINGFEIKNQDDAFALYERLKNNVSFDVELERNGRIMYLSYMITGRR
jgi:type II secretory pathway component PulC